MGYDLRTTRAFVPRPPVGCWTGHPVRPADGVFRDCDVIEFRQVDEPTRSPMAAPAASLAAGVVDDESRPA